MTFSSLASTGTQRVIPVADTRFVYNTSHGTKNNTRTIDAGTSGYRVVGAVGLRLAETKVTALPL